MSKASICSGKSAIVNVELFKGKKVLVMGLGKFGGGLDCAVFASDAGADVLVTDLAEKSKLQDALGKLSGISNIQYRLGEHLESDFANTDIVIVNPAVPPGNKFVKIAEDAGALITSQIEIFFQLCPAQIVGITGANGKSTTTALTHHLLKAGDRKVFLGGNIGNRPLLSILDEISGNDIVVLEISSFQTEQLERIGKAPYVSVITNLTPNHLDRHGTFKAYCDAKEVLFTKQQKPCVSIFNGEDEITAGWFDKYCDDDGRQCFKYAADDVGDEMKKHFKLAGKMNLSNLAAALCVAKQFDIKDDAIADALESFTPLPDRLEFVAEIDGVKWYNDSISTTPTSTIAALEAFDQPKIIIAGGYDKGLPFDELGRVIVTNAKAAVLIGAIAEKIAECIETAGGCKIVNAASMEEAVKACSEIATCGDVVLMSPACASYDMFDNYKQRGQAFKGSVTGLKS